MTPPDPIPTRRREGVLVFALACAVLAMGAWARPLYDADEGRYASVAAHMVETGDYVVPHLNDMPFMDKPPLVYWVQAVGFHVLGRCELAARLPTLLAGALVALFLFQLAWAWTRRRGVAWLAAGTWCTSVAGMVGSRVGPQMDMPLCACITGALVAAYALLQEPSRRAAIGLGCAVGAGLLTKGPLVVAVPALVAVAWMAVGVAPARVLRVVRSPWAWGVALLVAAPWYVLVERAQPGWIRHFIEYEHFGRFQRGDHRSFHPFWFYVPVVCVYLLPWLPLTWGGRRGWHAPITASPWSPAPWRDAMASTSPLGRGGRDVRHADLAWAWFAIAFLLYSVATRKLLNYILPAVPPLFVLVGARLAPVLRAQPLRVVAPPLVLALGCGLGALVIAGAWWFPLRTGAVPPTLDAPRWAPWAPYLGAAAGCLALGAAVAWIAARRAVAVGVLLLAVAGAWWLADLGLARAGPIGSARALARALHEHRTEGDALVSLKRYPQGLGFYDGPPMWIAGGTPEDWWQREIVNPYARRVWAERPAPGAGAEGRGALLTSEAFDALWSGARRVVLVCRWREIELLGAHIVAGPFAGAGRTDLYLATNHKP